MKTSRKWLLYCVYILAATGFFLYYRFPSDTVSRYLMFHAAGAIPNCSLTVGRIKPAFPPGLKLEDVLLEKDNKELLQIEHVRISPGVFSLLKGKPAIFVEADTYSGTVAGRINSGSGKTGRVLTADVSMQDIALEKIAWLKTTTKRKISGTLEGKILYNQESLNEPFRAGFTITDLTIELLVPVFNMATIAFKTVETDIVMNSQQLLVNRCVLRGQKVDGTLSGSVILKDPFEKSTFNLSGTIKIHPGFMAYLQKNLPRGLLPKKKPGSNSYPIRFFGTLDKPGFSLK